ncbi:MAG TPA: VapA/VapB family virulence-associated protein [Longimicrobium sp.]|nr:VapA/VapB family virulence-associated protein [Longimicrobium sp.]
MSEQTVSVGRDVIAQDFAAAVEGKLEPAKIAAAVARIRDETRSYPAHGSVIGAIFYQRFQVTIDGGKTFTGDAGGLSGAGGGALIGDVYTDDLNRLYANTVSFQFTGTTFYFSLVFFDGSSNQLGTFQSGAVSSVGGIGGGSGSWS